MTKTYEALNQLLQNDFITTLENKEHEISEQIAQIAAQRFGSEALATNDFGELFAETPARLRRLDALDPERILFNDPLRYVFVASWLYILERHATKVRGIWKSEDARVMVLGLAPKFQGLISKDIGTEVREIVVLIIRDLLDELEKERREDALVIEGVHFYGYTQTEIAKHLGLDISTINNRYKRALNWLNSYYKRLDLPRIVST